MQKNGWIRLYRQMENWPLYFSEPFTRTQAWIDLILFANTQKGEITIRGKKIQVERGEIAWDEEFMARRWQWSRGKVRRFLIYLKTVQQVVQRSTAYRSVLTIVNYDNFQKNGTTSSTTIGADTILERNKNIRIKEEEKKKSKKKRSGGAGPPAHKAREFFSQYQEKGEGYTGLIHTIALKRNLPPEIVRAELDKFCLYWTEKNHSGTKTRWEMEKVFEVERRLTTWFSRAHLTQQKPVGVFIS